MLGKDARRFYRLLDTAGVEDGDQNRSSNMLNIQQTRASLTFGRLGIELTKILVLQYSNQETSVTIGESVRDEDGMQQRTKLPPAMSHLPCHSIHPTVKSTRRRQ